MKNTRTETKKSLMPHGVFRAAVAASLAAGLTVYLALQWMVPAEPQVRPVTFAEDASWIGTMDGAQATGCFRKEIRLQGSVRNAWCMISADAGFELTVNGDSASRFFLWRATRPFQTGLGSAGQRLDSAPPMLALNFPREYQWTGHASHRLPVFVDLTPYLRNGRNVLAMEVESRHSAPAFILEGEVELKSGERVALCSDASWRAEPVPTGLRQAEWLLPDADVSKWRQAVAVEGPSGSAFRLFAREAFAEAFHGRWIGWSGNAPARYHEFTRRWDAGDWSEEAILRMVTAWPYQVWVNGERVRVRTAEKDDLHHGDWLVRPSNRGALAVNPTLLDPDEVESLFAGTRFESPRHGDPTVNAFKKNENTLNRTRERPRATGGEGLPGDDPSGAEAKGRPMDENGPVERPELRTPRQLTRERLTGRFHIYDISRLLQSGENEIRVRLIAARQPPYDWNWQPRFALDAGAKGGAEDWRWMGSDSAWTVRARNSADESGAASVGHAAEFGGAVALPEKRFLGHAGFRGFHGAAGVATGGILGALVVAGCAGRGRGRVFTALRKCYPLMGSFSVLAGMCVLLAAAFAERSEQLLFRREWIWPACLCFAAAGAGVLEWLRRDAARFKSLSWNDAGWRVLVVAVLLLCVLVRAWKLDHQPLDDDEYASTQAVLSIAETGVPEYAEGVWYTRSPLYHYLTGALASVLGGHIWTLRLASVFFSAATAWLLYLYGSKLLRSRWTGLGAMVLFAVHPFLIFSGHIARFYQQQQFFLLLTIYLFIRGFVQNSGMRDRYLAIAAFLAAILSQEISILTGGALAIAYALMGTRRSWGDEIKILVAGGCAFAVVALDIAFFKMKCLTYLEGVSPNVEATIGFDFREPLNFFALLIGYSRLHIVLSVFFLAGLVHALARRRRTVLCLHLVLLAGVVLTNVLVTSVSLRYQYAFIPLWILLGVDGIGAALRAVLTVPGGGRGRQGGGALLPWLAAAAFVCVLLSWSPWRIPGSYGEKILGDSTGAFRYVAANLREDDRVAATEPHPHAALLETGRADYDLAVPILYDFVFRRDGRLIDRNGSAEVIGKLGQLQEACARHERIWVVVNREKFRSRGKNLRWEYPGARVELFLRKNFDLKFRSYLWSVYLWDRNAGRYARFREEPLNWID